MPAIINAQIIVGDKILPNHCLVFNEQIVAVATCNALPTHQLAGALDARGHYVSAGFIDIHLHGLAGLDTMHENPTSLLTMSRLLPSVGVTAFLPTTMTMPMSRIESALHNIRRAMHEAAGAAVLGAHLEGPFISPLAAGAHNISYISNLQFAKIAPFREVIKIVTFAPEALTATDFIKECRRNNIVASIGHTKASYDEARVAIEDGANLFTHLFNAMPPLHHRTPGAVGAALDSDAYCELIADNIHIHPAMQRLVVKAKGTPRIILVSDSTMACLPDGVYSLGGQDVLVENNVARLRSGALAGSTLTLNQAIKNTMLNTGFSLPEVVLLATANPARLLGIENIKGHLAPGLDADFTIFDADMNIQATYTMGRQVYRRTSHAHLCG
ncbi:MAG: N-acetylglucosamine-6-phosphate deacetylase [Peptococcaceae bacterium]|nr:N-acetylglucosamine-6-phosphate deacetylase [Peptococcaceae bacterium]